MCIYKGMNCSIQYINLYDYTVTNKMIYFVLLMLCAVPSLADDRVCVNTDRKDCGYIGITVEECYKRDCCYSASHEDKVPWCFQKSILPGGYECATGDEGRSDCGYYGIDQKKCEELGCCWGESDKSGVPWCYFKTEGAPTDNKAPPQNNYWDKKFVEAMRMMNKTPGK